MFIKREEISNSGSWCHTLIIWLSSFSFPSLSSIVPSPTQSRALFLVSLVLTTWTHSWDAVTHPLSPVPVSRFNESQVGHKSWCWKETSHLDETVGCTQSSISQWKLLTLAFFVICQRKMFGADFTSDLPSQFHGILQEETLPRYVILPPCVSAPQRQQRSAVTSRMSMRCLSTRLHASNMFTHLCHFRSYRAATSALCFPSRHNPSGLSRGLQQNTSCILPSPYSMPPVDPTDHPLLPLPPPTYRGVPDPLFHRVTPARRQGRLPEGPLCALCCPSRPSLFRLVQAALPPSMLPVDLTDIPILTLKKEAPRPIIIPKPSV